MSGPDLADAPPSPARLRGLLADPETRADALLHLQARLARGAAPDERPALIALLPRDLTGLRPELQLVLADIYLSVATWSPGQVPTIPWRAAELLPAVALAWTRLELRLTPTRLDGPLTLAAVRGLQPADLHAPEALLTRLIHADDPALQHEALRLLIGSLHAALLAPAGAAALLLDLLADDTRDPAVAAAALRHLCEPWAHAHPCPRKLLLRLFHAAIADTLDDPPAPPLLAPPTPPDAPLDPADQADLDALMAEYGDHEPTHPEPSELAAPTHQDEHQDDRDTRLGLLAARRERALAAIDLAARQDLGADLHALADDPDIDASLRRAAFLAAAPRCERDNLGDWLALVTRDPPLFVPVLLPTLRSLHRRGIFLTDAELPAILELSALAPTLDLPRLAAHCFPARHALIHQLREIPGDDPRWPRWLPLLAALDSDEVAPLLRERLAAEPPPRLRRELLRHLGELRDPLAEPLALALLPREPAAVLGTLRAVGGPATIAVLRRDLGLDDNTPVRPHLHADIGDALALLWHLLPDEDPTREHLRARLRPASCPPQIARDLAHHTLADHLPLLLTSAPEPAAVVALQRVCATGSRRAVPLVRDLLRRIVSELVAGTLVDHHGAARRPPPGATRASEAERQLPAAVLAAIGRLGERLHERGAIRPACLLTGAPGLAGDALLAELLLELAADATDPEAAAIALHALATRPVPGLSRRVHRYLRHRDVRVRAAAIVCLARHGVDDLCASLTRLAHSDDLVAARQALQALGDAAATDAAPTIAAWLEHPNMNLKKAAATALRRAGTPEVVPALLRWLGQHDNPGLRDDLSAALTAILGDATTTTLIAALDDLRPDDPDLARRRRLLRLALDPALTPALSHALARRRAPWFAPPTVPTAPATTPPVPALRPAIAGLLADGFTAPHAAALLAAPHDLTPPELTAVRPYLREWLTFLADDRQPPHNLQTTHNPPTTDTLQPAHNLPTTHNPPTTAPLQSAHNLQTNTNLQSTHHPLAALALILQLAAAGLAAPELALTARAIDPLAARLDDGPREPLLALLDVLLPHLPPLAAWRLADRLRASSPQPACGAPWLTRLARCGVLLTRADLERALHDCAGTPDPAALARATLRDALALPPLTADEHRRRPELAAALRADHLPPHAPGLTPSLRADLYPELPADRRAAWLDHLLHERPLGVPAPPAATPPRLAPSPDERADLPRLLARLDCPLASERQRAAAALLAWPDTSTRPAVLAAYLAGRVELTAPGPLAEALAADPELLHSGERDPARLTRIAALLTHLDGDDRRDHIALLLRWWTHGPEAARAHVTTCLRMFGPRRLLPLLMPRLRAGEWGLTTLLLGDLDATPEWLALLEQAPPALATTLRARTVPGPLGPVDQHQATLAALASLLDPLTPPPPPLPADPAGLRERLHDADPEAIRHALTDMSHAPGPDWPELLDELVDHPSPRVRLHAHRLLRASGERERYLAATLRLLADPRVDIQRMAMRALAHAGHAAAAAPLASRLVRDHDPLHREVIAALRRLGPLARPALIHARNRARPDRRVHHDRLLAAIAADHP